MKRRLVIISVIMCILAGLIASARTSASEKEKLTLMIYMCGSDLESKGGSATKDLKEMIKADINTEEVNVLIMAGGTKRWMNDFSPNETSIYRMKKNGPVLVQSNPSMNMGDAETLTHLLEFGYNEYPAQKYALILWDHGGGPLKGVCWDITVKNDNLSMEELENALLNSPFRYEDLEWLGFDACLMSSVEVAACIAPYAHYMVASQETEPSRGWDYSFLHSIENDTTGAVTGRRIIDAYFEDAKGEEDMRTLSCLNLNKIDDVKEAADNLFALFNNRLTKDTYPELSNLRQETKGFGRAFLEEYDYDLIDMADLAKHYQEEYPESKKAADNLLKSLDRFTVYNRSNMDNSNGVSVYYPYYNKSLYKEDRDYSELLFPREYARYVVKSAAIWLGEKLYNWGPLQAVASRINKDGTFHYSYAMSQEQLKNFASAKLIVIKGKQYGSEEKKCYSQVMEEDGICPDENGSLIVEYKGRALYAVDENNEPLTGALEYHMLDGLYLVYANYVKENNYGSNEVDHVLYHCELDKESDELKVLYISVYDDKSKTYTNRSEFDPEKYDAVVFPDTNRLPTDYLEGGLKGFEQWQESGANSGNYIYDKIDDWHFKFSEDRWSGEDFYGSFQITDVQGYTHMTDLAPIENPHRVKASITPEVIEGYKIDASAYIENVKHNPNIEINIDIEKDTFLRNKRLEIKDYRILVDGEYSIHPFIDIDVLGYSRAKIQIMLYSDDLTGLGEIDKLDFTIAVEDKLKSENVEYIPVSFQCEGMDVSAFARSEAQFDTISECITDDANYRLMALRREKNGNLSGTILCENPGDTIVKHSIGKVIINGIQTDHSYVSFDIYTFAKSSMYVDFSVDVRHMDYFGRDDLDDGITVPKNTILESGIDDISTIEFIGDTGSEQPYKIKFNLNPPFTYRTEWDEKNDLNNAENAAVQIAEKLGCIISVAEVKRRDGEIYVKLLFKNTSTEDKKVILSNGMIENIEADLSFADVMTIVDADMPVYADTTVVKAIRFSSDTEKQGEKTPGGECRFMIEIVKDGVRYPLSLSMTLGEDTGKSIDDSSFKEIPLSEITFDCVDLSVSGGNQPLLDTEVHIPEGYELLKKEFVLDLSEENLSEIQEVKAGVVRRIKDLPEIGYEGDVSKAGELVSHLHWTDLKDCGGGIYKGEWSGMLLKIAGADNSFIYKTEYMTDGNWTMEGNITPIFNDEYAQLPLIHTEFTIVISDDSGVITDYRIVGGDEIYDNSVRLWKEIDISPTASEIYPDGDGVYGRNLDMLWILDAPAVPVEGKSLQLELVPAEKQDDLEIDYLVKYKDGTQKILGFEPYK